MTTKLTASQATAQGKAARKDVPRSTHAAWAPAPGRGDPVSLLTDQDAERLQWLVPVRHGRMAESPFAFYRGGAAIMAADLAHTPVMGSNAQLCGDAHLANFGTFASAERRQVFDVNDFDETLPGPWEWDVKRMAASFVLAARSNGFSDNRGRQAAVASVTAYRESMAKFAAAPALDVWYAQADMATIANMATSKTARKQVEKGAKKARGRNSEKALTKLTETVDGKIRIRSNPPLLVPLRDLKDKMDVDAMREENRANFEQYRRTLLSDRRHILEQFEIVDMALKVVGVGSVGTRCFIVLLKGSHHSEPLFLQIKEASSAVLEAHLPASTYSSHGERVVAGQRMTQASTDLFLGWSESSEGAQFYWRQFHDMKGSADTTQMDSRALSKYASLCGWTLAHAHARTGDAGVISGYLGSGKAFDKALGSFAVAYANQNDADYEAFTQAIKDGRIEAQDG